MTTAGWYPNPSGAPGTRYWWIVVAIAATLALAGCGGAPASTAESTLSSPMVAAESNVNVAAAAEKYVTDNLGGNPSTSSWGRYISGYSYNAGVLRVALQVDRGSVDGKEAAEQAARAIANFIRLGSPPPELAGVNWVEVTDGSGAYITQSEVR